MYQLAAAGLNSDRMSWDISMHITSGVSPRKTCKRCLTVLTLCIMETTGLELIMCKRSHSSGLQALSNIAYMSGPHQHRVRLADNKIIFIMLVSSEVWAGGYFATISPDWSLLQNGRWPGYWASLCRVILISREENNQQCDRYLGLKVGCWKCVVSVFCLL